MLARSSASSSLVDILAGATNGGSSAMRSDGAGMVQDNASRSTEGTLDSSAAHGSRHVGSSSGEVQQHSATSAVVAAQTRPAYNRQQSSSSAKSITARLQSAEAHRSSGSSTTSSASSDRTTLAGAMTARPGSIGSSAGSSTGTGTGPPEISPRSSIALSLAVSGSSSVNHGSAPRLSTRPSNKRASSYSSAGSSGALPIAAATPSAASASSGSLPLHRASHSSAGALGQSSSSTSPPMAAVATAPSAMMYGHQQRPLSSLRTEWRDPYAGDHPYSAGGRSPSSAIPMPGMGTGAYSQQRRSSRDSAASRTSIARQPDLDHDLSDDADRSAPSSYTSHSAYFQPFPRNDGTDTNAVASTSYSPPSTDLLHAHYGAVPPRSPILAAVNHYKAPPSPVRASSSPPRARDFALLPGSTGVQISPLTASNIRAKGKEVAGPRSRQTSSSSRAGDRNTEAGDLSVDELTTDLASDAGTAAWDVRETDKLRSTKDALGRKMINQYARVAEIGKGVHGKVWLCEDTETGEYFAIKCVNRESRRQLKNLRRSQAEAAEARRRMQLGDLHYGDDSAEPLPRWSTDGDERDPDASFDEQMQLADSSALARRQSTSKRPIVVDDKVKQEIAIMKRCNHEHVVQLREVIDDRRSKKVFMVLEYMPGGQIEWAADNKPLMTVDESRRVFRDVVLGLEYLHHQGIIHRDIKPANLLWTQDRSTVKISDFGVSHLSEALQRTSATGESIDGKSGAVADDSALRKTEGSPAFFAPELCAGSESTPVGTPMNELERTPSRPDYFRRTSALSSGSGGSGERQRPTGIHQRAWTPMADSDIPKRPSPAERASTQTITTISHPLSAQQQKAHRTRAVVAGKDKERPIIGKGIDVWALGVTLYCLLFGFTPFHEATTEYELYNMIPKKEIVIPPNMGSDRLKTGSGIPKEIVATSSVYTEGREVVDLLARLLEKDPSKRIELHEVKKHPWVLRNLVNSQVWLKDHDLAETGVVSVTEEEVQHATAERTAPQVPTGLKASFKRFGDLFGFSGQSFLRKSTASRRNRSKSVSSTSASITTASASAWDGRSEPSASRAASRQASIVKKPSRTHPVNDTLDTSVTIESNDSNALVSHAIALKRKLANAKAARDAHEAAVSVSSSSPPDRLDVHPRHGSGGSTSDKLSRSLSSSDSGPASASGHTFDRNSDLLQAPATMKRRVSLGTDYFSHPNASAPQVRQSASSSSDSRPNSARPSLSSGSSRPVSYISGPSTDNEAEGNLTGRIKNMWQKIRSGSRTPAARQSRSAATTPGTTRGVPALQPLSPAAPSVRRPQPDQPNLVQIATREALPEGSVSRSPGSTRRASMECLVFSPTSSASRPSSQDTEPESRPPLAVSDINAKLTAAKLGSPPHSPAFAHPRIPTGAAFPVGLPEAAISDSSDSSLSDGDSDDEDYGEAISPSAFDGDKFGSPSSPQPIMWADNANGWHTNNAAMSADVAAMHFASPEPSPAGDLTSQHQASRLPPLRLDASTSSRHAATSVLTVPLPSPVRLSSPTRPIATVGAGNTADDENDDEEEEEVMIKPRSRFRRGTNASQGGSAPPSLPNTARPSMPASPRVSYQGAILKPV